MHFLLFFVLSAFFLLALSWTLRTALLRSKWEYIFYFLLLYFPVYTVYLSTAYASTESVFLVKGLQLLKDVLVVLAVVLFVLFQKNIFRFPWKLLPVDKIFLAFMGLAFLWILLPLGEAGLISKLLYFKGMLIPALIYFMGRNTNFEDNEVKQLFTIIFIIGFAALGVNLIESIINTHLQSFTGYALFNQALNDVEPSGNFGLTWTFETQAMTKRLASFFSDPLELASSVLLAFAAGLIWFLTSKREYSSVYLLVMLSALGSLFFSSSRAAFGAFFIMIFFIALVFRLYKLILFGLVLLLAFVVFVLFFASEDFYYFVIDTLTFQNASSLGHVIEWLDALESMIENPLGLGLATSGNMGSVDRELQVGGENQFLIYGVQLGWLGMILYIALLAKSISASLKVFHHTPNVMTARIAFTAAAVKVGLLLPLFTANAEMYAYVSWSSWWMVGYAMNHYPKQAAHEA